MSPAQKRALQQAKDEGSLVMSGLHATSPLPRKDVIRRLYQDGYLAPAAGHDPYVACWTITDAGREVLEQ